MAAQAKSSLSCLAAFHPTLEATLPIMPCLKKELAPKKKELKRAPGARPWVSPCDDRVKRQAPSPA